MQAPDTEVCVRCAQQGALIDLLVDEYALSPQANHRKARQQRGRARQRRWADAPLPRVQGGLIGLAAAIVGLSADHEPFLKARGCAATPGCLASTHECAAENRAARPAVVHRPRQPRPLLRL